MNINYDISSVLIFSYFFYLITAVENILDVVRWKKIKLRALVALLCITPFSDFKKFVTRRFARVHSSRIVIATLVIAGLLVSLEFILRNDQFDNYRYTILALLLFRVLNNHLGEFSERKTNNFQSLYFMVVCLLVFTVIGQKLNNVQGQDYVQFFENLELYKLKVMIFALLQFCAWAFLIESGYSENVFNQTIYKTNTNLIILTTIFSMIFFYINYLFQITDLFPADFYRDNESIVIILLSLVMTTFVYGFIQFLNKIMLMINFENKNMTIYFSTITLLIIFFEYNGFIK